MEPFLPASQNLRRSRLCECTVLYLLSLFQLLALLLLRIELGSGFPNPLVFCAKLSVQTFLTDRWRVVLDKLKCCNADDSAVADHLPTTH